MAQHKGMTPKQLRMLEGSKKRDLSNRAAQQRAAGQYTSPFEFKAHYPGKADPTVAVTDPLGISQQRATAYAKELKSFNIKSLDFAGSNVRFGTEKGIISLPLLGPVYSRTKGTVSGYQGGVNLIRMQDNGVKIQTAEEAIMDSIRSNKDIKAMRRAVESTHQYLRHKEVSPYMRGASAMRNSMEMLTKHQYRWSSEDIIPASALSKKVQGMGYQGFRFGGSSLYGKTAGGGEQLITKIGEMGSIIPDLLKFASHKTGRKLHWDPMSDHGPLAGRFASFGAADIDPFGNLQKAGAKHAQQFRTIGLNIDSMGGYAHAVGSLGTSPDRGALFAGRALRSHLERQGSLRAATMQPGAALRAGSQDIVSGLNVAGRLLFGTHANQLPETESVVVSKSLARALRQGTGLGHVGTSTPVFTGTIGKGNIIGTSRIAGMGKAQVARAGHFKTGAELTRSMMYGYVHAGLKKGHSWETVTGALRQSLGAEKFLPGSHEAVLKASEKLFTNASTGADDAMNMLRNFGNRLGVTTKDFVVRDKAGQMIGMDVLEHVGVREQALNTARSHLRHGLNIGGGQRIAQNYSAIFRGLGSESLADLFSQTRHDPQMMQALDFRRNVLGTLGHLLGGDVAGTQVKGQINRMHIDELRVAAGGQASAIKDLLHEFGPSTGNRGYGGIADAMQKRGILPEMFQGGGFHLQLGANVPVHGVLDKTYANAPLSGVVSEIAIPNVAHTNIKDEIASRVLRMAAGEDVGRHGASLSKQLLGQYLGGKKSLIAQLASPRVGSEMIHTVQKATTLDPTEYAGLVNEYLDNLKNAGKLTPAQRAAMDPTKQRYGFVSGHRARDLSLQHRAIHKDQGFLRSIATRDPVKGRGVAMRLLMPMKKYMPKKLQGLLGGQGIVTGISDVNFLEGDTDFDTVRTMIAEGIEGDPKSALMMKGFGELERSQQKTLQYLDADTARRVKLEREVGGAALAEDFITGLDSRGASDSMKAFFGKTMGQANREKSILATTGLKALTGHSYNPALHRQMANEARTVVSSSPFNSQTVARYYSQDYLPGMQQLFISKHNVEGKKSLEMIQGMTGAIHAAALARSSADVGAVQTAQAYETAKAAVRNVMLDVHSIAGNETNVAYSGAHAKELFGIEGAPGKVGALVTDRDVMEKSLMTGRGNKTVESIVEAEMTMNPDMQWIKGIGNQYKDAYSESQMIDQLSTIHGKTTKNITDVQREMGRMMNAQLDASVEVIENADIKRASMEAANFKKEVAAEAASGLTAGKKDVRMVAKGVQEAVIDSISKHPKAFGLAGIVAGGMLALGVVNAVGRKVDQWTSPAGQEGGVPMTPRSEYFIPEESMLGHQLNGTMSLPPDAMPAMMQGFNRADPRADIRVMDSRVGISDRVLGYDAEKTMSSLYARKQI